MEDMRCLWQISQRRMLTASTYTKGKEATRKIINILKYQGGTPCGELWEMG